MGLQWIKLLTTDVHGHTLLFRLLRQKLTSLQNGLTKAGAAVPSGLQRSKSRRLPFLDLPVEIRNEIYRFCLCRNEDFLLGPWHDLYVLHHVNKLVYQEALAVAYTYNTFEFISFRKLNRFFERIQQDGRTFLRELGICWMGREGFEAVETCFSYLTQCTNLESLGFYVVNDRGSIHGQLYELSEKGLLVRIPSLKKPTLVYSSMAKRHREIEQLITLLLGHGAGVQQLDVQDRVVYVVNQSP